jgi:hypothetical protein
MKKTRGRKSRATVPLSSWSLEHGQVLNIKNINSLNQLVLVRSYSAWWKKNNPSIVCLSNSSSHCTKIVQIYLFISKAFCSSKFLLYLLLLYEKSSLPTFLKAYSTSFVGIFDKFVSQRVPIVKRKRRAFWYYHKTSMVVPRMSTEVGFCNSAELGIFSELGFTSAEFLRTPCSNSTNTCRGTSTTQEIFRRSLSTYSSSVAPFAILQRFATILKGLSDEINEG